MRTAPAAARLAAAALLALAASRPGAAAGEAAPPPGPHWRQPVALPDPAGDMRYGHWPHQVACCGDRLVAAVRATNNQQLLLYVRDAAGTWSELGTAEGQQVSRFLPDGERLLCLTAGQSGLRLVAVSPGAAADARTATHDVEVPEAPDQFGRFRQQFNVMALDLAAHGGRLHALCAVAEYTGAGNSLRVTLRSSADGGKTWGKPRNLAEGQMPQRGPGGAGCLALWSGKSQLHALYSPPAEEAGKPAPALRHSVSADGETWKDAPALPDPAEGAKLATVCPAVDGERALLLAADAGGKVWLYRAAADDAGWDKPLPVGQVKTTAPNTGMPPLSDCSLSAAPELLVFSQGRLENKQNRDPATGGYTMTFGGSATLLVSRDDGATWSDGKLAAGLAGRAVAPRAAAAPGGAVEAVLAWTDDKGQELLLLGRTGLPAPPAAAEDAVLKEKLAGLVRDLAHADWRQREHAAAEIARFGTAALPALRQAARDGDAERSLAAENLIRRIRPPWSRE